MQHKKSITNMNKKSGISRPQQYQQLIDKPLLHGPVQDISTAISISFVFIWIVVLVRFIGIQHTNTIIQ